MSEQQGGTVGGKVGETTEKIGDGLEKVAGKVDPDGDLDEALKVAAAGAKTTSNVAKTVGEVSQAADRARRGDVSGAVGSSIGALGGTAGGVSSLSGGIGHIVPAGEAREILGTVSEVAGAVQQASQALRGVGEQVAAWIAGDPTDDVKFEFESDGLPGEKLGVRALRFEEALNEPYKMRVDLISEDPNVDMLALLGRDAKLVIRREPAERTVLGIVHRIEEGSMRDSEEHGYFSVEVVPAFALLGLKRDTRAFQEKKVPEILEEVLAKDLEPYMREVRLELQETYLVREYCLQYDETDLDFVSRLMEEEGITYRFEHDGDVEVLVLLDNKDAYPKVGTLDGGAVPYVPVHSVVRGREPIDEFHPTHVLRTTSTVLRDFDWSQQGQMRIDAEQKGEDEQGRDRASYEHHTRVLTITDYDSGVQKYQKHDATRQSQIRNELHGRDKTVGMGVGRVITFSAGMTFELQGHPNVGADGTYVITRVVHTNLQVPGTDAGKLEQYHNRFECQPLDVPHRPARKTAKPRIHGIQTAVVVGPAGEEIHVDEHGRIKVEFHWDRLGKQDDKSSCWMRVQQPWAGSGWGFVFIPRVGMEVLVSFLDGDPDRPLVIGSVYNGTNKLPYTLPDDKTKSTLKTKSSPNAEGNNELRFEDKAGSEEIYVHAQKDYNEVVEHDHCTTVHNDQTNTVDGNQTQSVGGNQTESVTGEQKMNVDKNRSVHIKGSQSVTIDGGSPIDSVTGSKLNITGSYQVDASKTISEQAPIQIKLTCGGSSIVIEPDKITLTAGGAATLVLDANALMQSAAGSKAFLDANALVKASGGANVLFDANANMSSAAGSQVLLDANALTKASTGASVTLTADAKIHGAASAMTGTATADVQAPTATLAGGGGSVQAGGGALTATGGTCNVSGGTVNITGGMVAIN